MSRRTLNLGILAHVDAGKTTLTERLLHLAGVIDAVGSVDEGTTRTDTLALERARGITIKAAVVSFELPGSDVTVNLIDTPGHPDFIAEVERVLSLLDGAVLVISAVEGVQPQTRVLLRALRRLRVPTLLFINKIDRGGADVERVLAAVRARLVDAIIPLGTVDEPGTRKGRFRPYGLCDPAVVEALAEHSDAALSAYVSGNVEPSLVLRELAAATSAGRIHPVYCGSAVTGSGLAELADGIGALLPARAGDDTAAPQGRVFKIEHGRAGERLVYVRMLGGTVHTRQRLPAPGGWLKPTQISVACNGGWERRPVLRAGEVGRLAGLGEVRIGDTVGVQDPRGQAAQFPPPTMQTVIAAVRPRDDGALRAALARLAEEDPLINVRWDGREISLSLYGDVQKEVIEATLATEFGIGVRFRETTTLCVERPASVGEAVEILNAPTNPFRADIGLRVEPGAPGSGVVFRVAVVPQSMPLFIYRNVEGFSGSMEEYVRNTLLEGRYGWQVTDCVVTLNMCGYCVPDGPPSRRGPVSTPTDFRHLTPMVLMDALVRAGTVVCEPMLRASIEVPVWAGAAVLSLLGRVGALVRDQVVRGELTTIEASVAAAHLLSVQRQLPAATAGEGIIESTFDGYRPVPANGPPRVRARTSADPYQRKEYLNSLTREGARHHG